MSNATTVAIAPPSQVTGVPEPIAAAIVKAAAEYGHTKRAAAYRWALIEFYRRHIAADDDATTEA